VFAVASRVFGRFLLLRPRPGLETRLPLLALGWGLDWCWSRQGGCSGPC
jgi:hypothetical protein